MFLSHAGEQKRNVVSVLHKELLQRGLRVFLDNAELPKLFPGSSNSKVIQAAATVAPLGLFVVSADFLKKNWPLREYDIFSKRAASSQSVRILPYFYWDGGFSGEWGDFSPGNLEKARAAFKGISGFNGIVRATNADDEYAKVCDVANAAVEAMYELDYEGARDKFGTSAPGTVCTNVPDTEPRGLAVDPAVASVGETLITWAHSPAHHYMARFTTVTDTPTLLAVARYVTAMMVAWRPPVAEVTTPIVTIPIVWMIDGRSSFTMETSLLPLINQMGLPDKPPSHGAAGSAFQGHSTALVLLRRLFALLRRWRSPWLLLITGATFDVGELDLNLFPQPQEYLASAGIVLLQTMVPISDMRPILYWTSINVSSRGQDVTSSAGAPAWRPTDWTVIEPTEYVDRPDLEAQLTGALQRTAAYDSTRWLAISGMGGIGKSTLAVKVAHRLRTRFTAGWKLDGSTMNALRNGLVQIGRVLCIRDKSPEKVLSFVRSELCNAKRAGWLLVIDGVDDIGVSRQLRGLIPAQGGCVLVTSRLTHWRREPEPWNTVDVSPMDPAQAGAVLGGESDGARAAVAAQLGYLPLALASARAYVDQFVIGWAAYLAKLGDQPSITLDARVPVIPSLRLSLQASLEKDPNAVRTMCQFLQVLKPGNIPREWLQLAFSQIYPYLSADKTLAVLRELSVISLTEVTINVHQLMQVAMRDETPCEVTAVVALMTAIGSLSTLKGPRNNYDLVRVASLHFDEMIAWLEEHHPDSVILADSLETCGNIHFYCFRNANAMPYLERCLTIKEQHFGKHGLEVAGALASLGNVRSMVGDAANGKQLLLKALDIRERNYGSDDVHIVPTLMHLGMAHGNENHVAEKAKLLERALSILESNLGPHHEERVGVLVNLGNAYGALGKTAKAKKMVESALAIQQQQHELDPADMVHTLCSLGDLCIQDDPGKAVVLLEQALPLKERRYGQAHIQVVCTLLKLARA